MDEVLLSTSKIPSDDVLERKYVSLINSKPNWNWTTWRFLRRYRFLTIKSWKPRWRGEEIRNFDCETLTPGTGEFESGALVKSRKGLIGVEGGKGICYQWKEKASVRMETSAVSVTKPKIVQKNHNTLPPLSSEPIVSRGRSVCRGRETSEAKVTMGPFFDNCVDISWKVLARERLVNIGIRPSANSVKVKRVVRLETSVCFHITRLMNNQNKKATKELRLSKKKETKRRQECLGYCEKCITIGLWITRPGVIGFSKMQTSQGETRCKKSLDRFEEYDSLSLRYVKHVSRKRKDHCLEKIQVKNPHQRSPYAMKFEDRFQEETERQQRCAQSKAWNLAKSIQVQRKRQGCILLSPAEEWVIHSCINKSAGGKRVCGWFKERVCIWSVKERL